MAPHSYKKLYSRSLDLKLELLIRLFSGLGVLVPTHGGAVADPDIRLGGQCNIFSCISRLFLNWRG